MKKFPTNLLFMLVLGMLICLPSMVSATFIINTSGFGSGAVIEGFEGITPGSPNTSAKFNTSWFNIGTTGPYDFGNGVTLFTPRAVYDVNNAGPYIHDFTLGAGTADQIPLGGTIITESHIFNKAYLGIWRDSPVGPFDLIFKFDHDVTRAGAYFTGYPEADTLGTRTYYLKALDASGNLVESHVINTVNVSNWASHFVGLDISTGFRSLVFSNPTYGQTVLDNLTFEPLASTNAVPLPGAVLLLGAGMARLVAYARRRQDD